MRQLATSDAPHHRGRAFDVLMGRNVRVESVRVELERILRGETFAQSERLKRFLHLAVEAVLEGRGSQLKEYLIGVEVFDRDDRYDPRTNPIVRVEARRLRSKLEEYYRTEGREDRLLIDLPKGSYVPVFKNREPKALAAESDPTKTQSPDEFRTIAVLPFADLSRENDQEYFCRGIADDLITALTRLEGLHVVSRTAAFQFRSKAYDVRTVGRRLKAGMVLEGSVQKVGQRVRVTAKLTSVADGYHLWSENYDRELNDVFAVEDEISKAIVKKLRTNLQASKRPLPSNGMARIGEHSAW